MSVYKILNQNTDIVAGTNVATAPLFNGASTVTAIGTATRYWPTGSFTPAHVNSGSWVAIYDGIVASSSHLFDVFYANWSGGLGSGTDAILYKSLATKILGDANASFNIAGSSSVMQICGVAIPRVNCRDRLNPGNWVYAITASSGPNVIRTFVDDSSIVSGTYTEAGLRGNIYSGAIGTVCTLPASGGIVGHVYYDLGLIILNPSNSLVPSLLASSSNNISAMYSHSYQFTGRSESRLQSSHYFCRLFNSEYNFSNNPTFIDVSNGNLLWSQMQGNPQVWPTTIGLFNDLNECLAIAKLSQPIQKSFADELIVQIRLDF
jgi:hypothetical protein